MDVEQVFSLTGHVCYVLLVLGEEESLGRFLCTTTCLIRNLCLFQFNDQNDDDDNLVGERIITLKRIEMRHKLVSPFHQMSVPNLG